MSFGSSTTPRPSTRLRGTHCWPRSRRPRRSCATHYLSGAARVAQRMAAHAAGRRASSRCRRDGALLGAAPALPEDPLVRRVRVRLGLGRRLPAPRPALLPEAAGRGAVHAGARAAAAGARRRVRAARWPKRCTPFARRAHAVIGPRAVPRRRRRPGAARTAGWLDARTACSSTGQREAAGAHADFDDFLASLQRDKRKKIQQERRKVADAGVGLHRARGAEIDATTVGLLPPLLRPDLPRRTARRPYLTRAFFAAMAQHDGRSTGCCSSRGAAASRSPRR